MGGVQAKESLEAFFEKFKDIDQSQFSADVKVSDNMQNAINDKCKEMFDAYDTNGNGTLEIEEAKKFMTDFFDYFNSLFTESARPSKEENDTLVAKCLWEMDSAMKETGLKDGVYSFDEFNTFVNSQLTSISAISRANSASAAAAAEEDASATAAFEISHDPSSYSNPRYVKVENFHLNLNVNFTGKRLEGYVSMTVKVLVDGANSLVLDQSHLEITDVSESKAGPLDYTTGPNDGTFGAPLFIKLPGDCSEGDTFNIKIEYSTTDKSSSIQWLPPSQTEGKQHPYLFTQNQAIHARTMFPCQDTCMNKTPYTAEITCPAPLVALMSAIEAKAPVTNHDDKTITYFFEQEVKMATYLVALAVGALESRQLGDSKHRVWCEKESVDRCAKEFDETAEFITTAESFVGPYVWKVYDLLVLPPSFPYGGMENPCLTFVTPTLLAGDRSLASVVNHEVCHSWMGNLVTCTTWESFWLNEGWCVFLERKVMGKLKGPDYATLMCVCGRQALKRSIDGMGCTHGYSCLSVNLDGVDPDDAFSSVPYDKGFAFLHHLEQTVGGPAKFEPFMKHYVETFSNSNCSSQEFQALVLDYFGKDPDTAQQIKTVDWDTWLHKPGMPQDAGFQSELLEEAHKAAAQIVKDEGKGEFPDLSDWPAIQKIVFLEKLMDLQKAELAAAESDEKKLESAKQSFGSIVLRINDQYKFVDASDPSKDVANSELRYRFLTLTTVSELSQFYNNVADFITKQGRMKFVRPLYRDLAKAGQEGEELAKKTFLEHKDFYHSICAKMVNQDLFGAAIEAKQKAGSGESDADQKEEKKMKKVKIERSNVTFDVTPDTEADYTWDQIIEDIKEGTKDIPSVEWLDFQIVTFVFGLKKCTCMCVMEDRKVSSTQLIIDEIVKVSGVGDAEMVNMETAEPLRLMVPVDA